MRPRDRPGCTIAAAVTQAKNSARVGIWIHPRLLDPAPNERPGRLCLRRIANQAGAADLSRPDHLEIVDEEDGNAGGIDQLFDLGDARAARRGGEPIVAEWPETIRVCGRRRRGAAAVADPGESTGPAHLPGPTLPPSSAHGYVTLRAAG